MKHLSPAEDLSAHLMRQLVFLRNSVAAYDSGCAEEAIRIGVVIRVLCHDTQSGTSKNLLAPALGKITSS